jgi:DNA-directed RNA polymerase subunit RPC12/RpoP
MKPATLTTIHNDRLLAICNHCAHTVELNVRQLIEKYGRDYEVPAIKRHLRCTRCGSDSCAVQLALPEDKFVT